MPKKIPSPAEMKAAIEAFKGKFTTGFYHGSPSNNIEAFDPSKGDRSYPTEGVTFVTRDSDFADSFLGMNRKGEYEKGSTVYPVSVNMGKHFVPGSPEGKTICTKIGGFLGNLIPFKKGGRVRRNTRALLHKGEYVLPAGVKPTKAQIKAVKKRGGKK